MLFYMYATRWCILSSVITMHSLWTDDIQLPTFDKLNGDYTTDILIIGGGLAGLLCAYELERAGVPYLLIEQHRICHGVTRDTTAKITAQHGLIYHTLAKRFGLHTARAYYRANQAAVDRYRRLCETSECDFKIADNVVYSVSDPRIPQQEIAVLRKIGANAVYEENLSLPFSVASAVRFRNQGYFHPLKFAATLAKELNICEHTRAVAYEGEGTVLTDHGRITAKRIIVTTHFPIFNKHGGYFLKLYQHRSYVLALSGAPAMDSMYVDNDQKGLSFRPYKSLLLLGGGSHRTGKSGGNWSELSAFAREYFPRAREAYRFATQDCMTLDGMPYIGQYSKNTPHLYVATGFNKWGMTSSMVAAGILADLVQNKPNPYASVFSPDRSIWHSQLVVNATETTLNLLTPTRPRCPHLGCALKWNEREHSWDCPCHGSRFSEEGDLLDGPATDDMK